MAKTASNSVKRQKTMSPHQLELEEVVCFEYLEVGPVKIEVRKLSCPYRIRRGSETWTVALDYAYEEDVFRPDDAASENLAAMVTAQIALNYGLFCREIIFHGVFDAIDRRFLIAMAENTAREIYVKKLLQPNPYLTGDATRIRTEKRKSYCLASLRFADEEPRSKPRDWTYWDTDKTRHATLSSGGKDSLLTYGLLAEMGREVHPIFLNESGRHWFTALNAYRHFKAHVPNTARVWVNSDRVFAFFARHIPFVRRDFQSVRADDYPIRLWTVAVFLFGALPLLRKRKIGRLLIGDEFDTTVRKQHDGITHYDGLYDQSRWFDDALSRYFLRKGWSVSQFSILRPLSEFLIQKLLADRYPELQGHQVSCHAAHQKDHRIYPCGRCEKCRRIVALLVALGADPSRNGYSQTQVNRCLAELVDRPLHQEQAMYMQLVTMLVAKKAITWPAASRRGLKEHPEVLHLRFDSEASPPQAIPGDLRVPLYRIYATYASGALQKQGRRWVPFDLETDPRLKAPYPFEAPPVSAPLDRGSAEGENDKSFLWAHMTWPEVEARLRKVDMALLPVGAIEQHGPHLTLDIDAFDADYLVRRVATACSDPKPFVLPLVPYGVSYHHEEFPGTVSLTNHTLAQLIYEIGVSVARNGIKKLIIVNGHGDNQPTLNYAAQMINRDLHIFCCVDSGETSDVDLGRISETSNDVHAGEAETSTSLAVRPNLVQLDKAERAVPEFSSRYLNFSSQRSLPWYAYTKRISESGIIGDPTKATAEKGKKMWEVMVAHLVALVEDLKNLTLDEIYQKRY